jgi:hypothetical protein
MTPLEKGYQNFLEENPNSELTFEDWKKEVLLNRDSFKEHRNDIIEIQKLTQKLLDNQKLNQNK